MGRFRDTSATHPLNASECRASFRAASTTLPRHFCDTSAERQRVPCELPRRHRVTLPLRFRDTSTTLPRHFCDTSAERQRAPGELPRRHRVTLPLRFRDTSTTL